MDTAAKRASAICPGLPFGRVLPIPSGTVDQGARQHVALCYAGILAGEAVEAETWTDITPASDIWTDVTPTSTSWNT